MRFWFKKKPNPAATADIKALEQAIKILERTHRELYEESGDSPQWSFVLHARQKIEAQREAAFRYAMGRGKP